MNKAGAIEVQAHRYLQNVFQNTKFIDILARNENEKFKNLSYQEEHEMLLSV